ncbi:hypothetical protein [Streptomyces sp. P17]|uniref:hypothetical protein n=1 Tax=Streptomyces sp. P17 TaxID=3074716 RepID=UPI0028F45776|nr:hypothetical protein [Streptomyces sp. P17]MDT9701668.1 hypothetical protein [Streptomyces sp. P17]
MIAYTTSRDATPDLRVPHPRLHAPSMPLRERSPPVAVASVSDVGDASIRDQARELRGATRPRGIGGRLRS